MGKNHIIPLFSLNHFVGHGWVSFNRHFLIRSLFVQQIWKESSRAGRTHVLGAPWTRGTWKSTAAAAKFPQAFMGRGQWASPQGHGQKDVLTVRERQLVNGCGRPDMDQLEFHDIYRLWLANSPHLTTLVRQILLKWPLLPSPKLKNWNWFGFGCIFIQFLNSGETHCCRYKFLWGWLWKLWKTCGPTTMDNNHHLPRSLLHQRNRPHPLWETDQLGGCLGCSNLGELLHKTSQELRMLSSVTINCQITKIVMNSGSQLSEL